MYAIKTDQLTKRFGSFTAVDHISFTVERGEIFGFLGANGAGKTTAMRMLCGLSVPTSGQASVAGFDVAKQSEQVKQHIGYMSQKFSLYGDLKVWENIRLFGGIYGLSKARIQEKMRLELLRAFCPKVPFRSNLNALTFRFRFKFALSFLFNSS